MTEDVPASSNERVPEPSTRSRKETLFGRRGRALGSGLLEGAFFVGIAFAMMWPVGLHLADQFVGWRDANYYVWLCWRVGELIRSGDIFSLRIPDVVWPLGVDLRLADGLLPSVVGGLWNLAAGPVLAFNLAIMTATLLNLWAGRRLGRLFSEHRAVWILVALAFASAPAIALRMTVHYTMYFAFTTPLLLEEAIVVARGQRKIKPVRLAVLLVLAYLCSVYYLVFGCIAYLLIVGIALYRRSMLTALRSLFVTGAVAGLLMSPFLIPRIELDRAERGAGGDPVLLRDSFRAGADALSVAAQPGGSLLDLPWSSRLRENFRDDNVPESTVFAGYLPLLSIGWLLLIRSPLRFPMLATTATLWLLTLGSTLKLDGEFVFSYSDGKPVPWLPYAALLQVPGLGNLRAGNRVSYTLAAALCVCLAMALGWLFVHFTRSWQRTVIIAGSAALLISNLIVPIPRSSLPSDPQLVSGLEEMAARGGDADSALVVPADCNGETLWTVKLQIIHRTPLIGCQASPASLPWYSKLDIYAESPSLASLRCVQQRLSPRRGTTFRGEQQFDPRDVQVLSRELGVRFFILDRELLQSSRCNHVRNTVLPTLSRFEKLGEDGRWVIFDSFHEAHASTRHRGIA